MLTYTVFFIQQKVPTRQKEREHLTDSYFQSDALSFYFRQNSLSFFFPFHKAVQLAICKEDEGCKY